MLAHLSVSITPSKRQDDETIGSGETYGVGTGRRSADRLTTVVDIDHHILFHRLTSSIHSFFRMTTAFPLTYNVLLLTWGLLSTFRKSFITAARELLH
jgi:hypothetical protein